MEQVDADVCGVVAGCAGADEMGVARERDTGTLTLAVSRTARPCGQEQARVGSRWNSKGQVMDFKLELIAIPVSDVDKAKAFYEQVGFNADHDHTVNPELRFVQLTPPGSACSICIGTGITDAEPGSVRGMQMVVDDADAAHAELTSRGVEVSEVDDQPWGRFVYFGDPDGNAWAIQQIVIPDLG